MSAPASSSSSQSFPPEKWAFYIPKKDLDACIARLSDLPSARIDLVVLTVNEAEFLAVFELLEPLPNESKILRCLVDSSIYYLGRYGLYNTALLSCHAAGMSNAMNSLGDALRLFKPRPQLVVNIGIAWGADPSKQKLGDVLVADTVVNADDVKIAPNQIIKRSPIPPIDDRTKTILKACKLVWKFRNVDDKLCRVHLGLYIGSNALLNNSKIKAEFLKRHPEAIGGEMESYAIYAAASRLKIPWMVIKGISDWGDGTKNDVYHSVATASAASFLHKICVEIPNLVERDLDEKKEKEVEFKLEGKEHCNLTALVENYKDTYVKQLERRIGNLKESSNCVIYCAITGIAGSGKSELAKAYTTQFQKSSSILIWRLDPDSNNDAIQISYINAFLRLLDNFNLQYRKIRETETSEQMEERLVQALWEKINQYSESIVIFDNAVSFQDIKRYLPTNPKINGLMLVTTRNGNFFTTKEANFSIDKGLDSGNAKSLLKEISLRNQETENMTQNLVDELDYSPLAIRVAASYIREVSISFNEYLQTLREGRNQELIEILGPNFMNQVTHDQSRNATLQATLRALITRLQNTNARLIKILPYCGYLMNEDIPLTLLAELCRKPGENIKNIELELKTVFQGHENYSLITYDKTKESCYLHRTTQVVIREIQKSPEILRKMARIVIQLYSWKNYSEELVKKSQKVEPHISAIILHIESTFEYREQLFQERSQLSRMLLTLSRSYWLWRELDPPKPELMKNKEYMLEQVQKEGHMLKYASLELQNDREVVLVAIQQDGETLGYTSPSLQSQRDIVMTAVQHAIFGGALEYASPEFQKDKEIVLTAVQMNGRALEYASPELQNDKEIILAAIQQDSLALECARRDLTKDKRITLAMMQKNGVALLYASSEFKQDKEIVLAAVQQNGYALQFASENLQKDKEFVLAAVKRSGYALKYASPELQNDREIVIAAVQQSSYAFQFASPELKKDRQIITTVAFLQTREMLQQAVATLK